MSWRRLRTLIRREALATLRDPFTVTILIMVPILALLLFGYVLSTEVKGLALGVLDNDGTSTSRRLVAELAAKGTFDAHFFANRAQLDHALVSGAIGAAIVIPPDFDRDLRGAASGRDLPQVQLIYDGGEAVLAGNAEGFLRGLITATVAHVVSDEGPPPAGARPLAVAPATAPAHVSGIEVVTRAVFNPKLDGTHFMVAGTFGFVLSFLTVLITAVSIVTEKLTGTFEQLQVTPANSVEILLGKILPLGAVFAFDVVLMVLIAGFLLHVWPAGSAVFFIIVSSFYVFVSLALGLIISATSATTAEAVQKSVLFSIPLIQLSGFAFPIRSMPTLVQWFAEVFPATHYIRISRAIYMRGEGPLALLPEMALLTLFAVILIAYALRTIGARH